VEDVVALGNAVSLPVSLNNGIAKLETTLLENDPRLTKLYAAIWEKYHLRPSQWTIIPKKERDRFFGVRRRATWSQDELDACELLWLQGKATIASHQDATDEQWERDDYLVKVDSKQKFKTQFGTLMPFTALAVAEPLRSQLESAELQRLYMPPVVFVPASKPVKKPLWALRSSLILPRPVNTLQGQDGEDAVPNTQWSCMWNDGGLYPPVLKFNHNELRDLASFDIAQTFEKVGLTRQGAYRQCIVSQRFRKVMTDLRVTGIDYVPVELV
jgi:hypothetical protein